ncbi:NADH:ubiquinone reductase (Na(+)-transporting) subunit F [Pelagibacterium montanilacus]|uniref:NADH:ubiquinone reductase (Na(+)-transporting) subunit F n=1 Tax=Pelagibacterium montanilacus TaxID=2185280 RepID=UPI000F8C9990|nr:NADH:ubiquinone reductase (Na(+)-transporting) subunit F [Pelagibacterium montanilacus]
MIAILLGTLLIVALVLTLTLVVMGARAVFSPAGPVEITINGATTIAGTTGRKLLGLLNDAGIPVPSACAGAGTCGLCKVRVAGGGTPLPTEIARLARADLREGQRLACQVVVREPLAVEVPQDILAAESWSAAVVSNTMVAPLIKELVLDLPGGRAFEFRAGAYVQVEVPRYALAFADLEIDPAYQRDWDMLGWRSLEAKSSEPVRRAYSIANRPEDKGTIVLTIRLAVPPPGAEDRIPPGVGSSWLFGLREGDTVSVAGPFGEFHAKDTDAEMVFIGGGVGMAPLRAMIHEQLAKGSKRKISFWYGARSSADIFYRQEFDMLARDHENFSWTPALSEPLPDARWTGATGFIHDVVQQRYLKDHAAPEACEYYLCGPPLMIQAVLAMLDANGVESSSIFNDDFGI